MPLEDRLISPHSVHPKHLLRDMPSTGTIVMIDSVTSTPQAETWRADVAAEPSRITVGLTPNVDGVSLTTDMIVLHIGDGYLYQPQSGDWIPLQQQPADGDTVAISRGMRHGNTLHVIRDDSNNRTAVHHSTIITREYIYPQVIDTVPQYISASIAEITGDELVSLDPITYVARVDGIYSITAVVATEYIGVPGIVTRLLLFRNDVAVVELDRRIAISNFAHMSGATMIRLSSGDVINVAIASSAMVNIPIVTAEPKEARITITRIQ